MRVHSRILARLRLSVTALLVLASAAAARTSVAQAANRIDRERGRTMLQHVREDIERNYYDSTFRGIDLATTFNEADTRIQKAASVDEIIGIVAQATLGFGDSHTLFIPPLWTTRVDYGWDMLIVGDSCYVSEVHPKSDAAAQGLRPGDAVLSVNGYRPTRGNLSQLYYVFHLLRPQSSLRVVVQTAGGEPRQLDIASKLKQRKRVMDLTGMDGGNDIWNLINEADDEAERLRARYVELGGGGGEGVLVWKQPQFIHDPAKHKEFRKAVKKQRSLVLDLRGNPGGAEKALVALAGFFFENDLEIATLRKREGDSTLVARGAGQDRSTGSLIVLIDSRSASASEMFARTIQLSKRGTVIGDRSAGAVMRSRGYNHRSGAETVIFYGTSVTISDVVMPDGGRLEGAGVLPDELILPTAADLANGRDPVLSRALALLGLQVSPAEAGAMFPPRRSNLR